MTPAPTAQPRRTEYLRLSEILADPANPKAHRTEVIASSVGRFGYIEQLTRDDRTGYLISGHGRAETLRMMKGRGETAPEGILVDKDGEWLAPVTVGWSSRSDTEARRALITLNRATEVGGWVDESLLDLLDTLGDDEDDLEELGFTEEDRETLRRLGEATIGGTGGTSARDEFSKAGLTHENDDRHKSAFRMVISFLTMEDYEEFRERLGMTGPRRPKGWFPEQPDLIEAESELIIDLTGQSDQDGEDGADSGDSDD